MVQIGILVHDILKYQFKWKIKNLQYIRVCRELESIDSFKVGAVSTGSMLAGETMDAIAEVVAVSPSNEVTVEKEETTDDDFDIS